MVINPFTTGNSFLGTKLLGFSIGRGSGAPKGLVPTLRDRPRNAQEEEKKTFFFDPPAGGGVRVEGGVVWCDVCAG